MKLYPMTLIVFSITLATSPLLAQQAPKLREEKPGLAAQATITPDSAQRRALAAVPGGKIRSAEIEEEKGKLVYSYDIKVKGKAGVEEVLIDAKTGDVVSHEHESAKKEAAEKTADAKAARKQHSHAAATKPAAIKP
jgi:hypothetical protein